METLEIQGGLLSRLMYNSRFSIPIEHMVSEEELRMLGLDPEELLQNLNGELHHTDYDIDDSVVSDDDDDEYEDIDDYTDDDGDDDDGDDDDDAVADDNFNPGFIINRNHFARVFWPQSLPLDDDNSNQSSVVVSVNYRDNFLDDSSTDEDDLENNLNLVDSENNSSSDENYSIESVSSSDEYVSSVDDAISMDSTTSMDGAISMNGAISIDSNESCHHFISYSESNDSSSDEVQHDCSFNYSTVDSTRNSNSSSPNSLNDSEDSNSYSSTSDSSSSN